MTLQLPIYELKMANTDNISIALVDSPAIEEDFLFFDKEEVIMQFNDDKMIITGPAFIPMKKIFRNDALGQRYVFMSEETIQKFAENLLNKRDNKFNLKHTDDYLDINIVESYFAKDTNEFNVPKGSWIVSAKVNDAETWSKIKSGELNGFSIEGMFQNELVQFEVHNKEKSMDELKKTLLETIKSVLFAEEVPEVKVEDVVEDVVKEEFKVEDVKVVLEEFRSALLKDLDEKIASLKTEVDGLNTKVEQFSEQPVSASVAETVVSNKAVVECKAAEYFA